MVVKSTKILFTSRTPGVLGLVKAIRFCGSEMSGSALADRVIGKAAALLCAYGGTAEVYAKVMSESGKLVLTRFGISNEYQTLVPMILDRDRKWICPFEKLTENVESPEQAFRSIEQRIRSMKQN